MFQQRHYQALATAFQDALANATARGMDAQTLTWFAGDLADVFGKDNPNFKRDLFLAACQPGANVNARTADGAKQRRA